ncbi:sensor histidine kinase [Bacillus toyonensis]|uniref:sensor histidine kinase n=1 Tax=Bacillus toyonensis TaxID=155322 RepID=UPI0032F7D64F|nr:HAMP domain-containing histidine kinase [Bacillus toyonensis]
MIKKLSLRWRLTLIISILLAICCIGLTFILNFSANRMANSIEATQVTPATNIGDQSIIDAEELNGSSAVGMVTRDAEEFVNDAKYNFRTESILYAILIMMIGGGLTYYLSGKALKPLNALNAQVKNINVHNLSKTLDIPPTKDEIAGLTKSFNDMTAQLNETFAMQQRFSASAAHELRTPLTVLQTKIDVFKKKNEHTSEDYHALITVIEKQTRRLRGLVGNLLDMSNRDEISEQNNILMKDLFDDIILELSGIAKAKNVRLSLNCDNSVIYGNTDLLYRAFYNLVENGIKYNVNGGMVTIEVSSGTREKVLIAVKDTGIGIPDINKKTIFEPFYRVDTSRSREMGGVGLGLSIVENIIKKHKGTISVSNNERGGTCFTVALNKTK